MKRCMGCRSMMVDEGSAPRFPCKRLIAASAKVDRRGKHCAAYSSHACSSCRHWHLFRFSLHKGQSTRALFALCAGNCQYLQHTRHLVVNMIAAAS